MQSKQKNLTLSSDNLTIHNFIGDVFYHQPENNTIGIVRTNIDNTVVFENPIATGNQYYDSMLNATALDFGVIYNGGSDETGNKWFKILTNVSSAHLNGGIGTYNLSLTKSFIDFTPYFYIYDRNGQLIASDVSGNLNPSFSLGFGKTYFIQVKTYTPVPFNLSVTYNNVGGSNNNSTPRYDVNSMFFSCSLDSLSNDSRIEKAELTIYQKDIAVADGAACNLGVYYAENVVYPECVLSPVTVPFDYSRIRTAQSGETVAYTFNITDFFNKRTTEEIFYPCFVVKTMDTDVEESRYITVYGGSHAQYAPKITVTYESGYQVSTDGRSQTHQLGRFGQGSVDLKSGNLTIEAEDFAWGGNRMPVTIKHLYNGFIYNKQYTANPTIGLNSANFDAMKVGYGFKLNVMQSMVKNADNDYVFIREDGNEVIFKVTENTNIYKSSAEEGELLYYEAEQLLENGDEYRFDELGRLISITDEYQNVTQYTYTNNRLTKITDPVGREFSLYYNASGYLTQITAPDGLQISYSYDGDLLYLIEYPSEKKVLITYNGQKPSAITLSEGYNEVYKIFYTFSGYNVTEIKEYGFDANGTEVEGKTTTFNYSTASNRTVVSVTDEPDNVYVFNDEGDIVSEYIDASGIKNAVDGGEDTENENKAGFVSNISNNLKNHNFKGLTSWLTKANNHSDTVIESKEDEANAKYGKHYLLLNIKDESALQNGVYQSTSTFGEGEYTFSAFVKVKSGFDTENSGVYLRISNADNGAIVAQSEKITVTDGDYIRLSASVLLDDNMNLLAEILADGKGEAYISAAQLEKNSYPNAYNMLENGHFINALNNESGWQSESGAVVFDEEKFGYRGALKLVGNINGEVGAHQTVEVKTADSTRETFKLSGWAKGYSKPQNVGENSSEFALKAIIKYADGTTCEETAAFCDYVTDWQYTSVEFSKDAFKAVESMDIYCVFNYNFDPVYFDNIELVRTMVETDLTEEDFLTDEDGEDTTDTEAVNDTQNAEEDSDEFEELLDAFGNTLTETTFTEGELGTIYRSFSYDENGNHLAGETDARGNVTRYYYNPNYSLNEETTDRLGNKTQYVYDDSDRITDVISKNADGVAVANVSYSYDAFDNLTEIVRGDGLKYVLKYNAFHNLESIGINGKTDGNLITYTYKEKNGTLKEISYANGDKMSATYNGYGQMISETWTDKNGDITVKYIYAYDGQGNIVRSIDILAKKMYNYLYNDGTVIEAVESKVQLNEDNFVTSKTVINTVRYVYDSEGKLTKKRIISANGEQVITYKTAENESQLVKTVIGENNFISTSKTDSFGRKEFDELQLETAALARKFEYLKGEATEEHIDNKLHKSTPTTQLVSEITFSDGRTIDYEYDAEERITKVIDSVEGTTEYTYDVLGQLLTETKNGQAVNTMTYDNYGNILTKNGVSYSYDTVWKDKLTSVGGQSITYDAQGNPLNYLGHTLTWEKGRQLKSFDNSIYAYNANGIRTSKTVDNVRHDFYLDSGKILSENWNFDEVTNTYRDILVSLYDNEESVCGIVYNGTPFYFQKNLQGDIIAITDKDGETVARYTYDAWGKCTVDPASTNTTIANINPYRYRGYYYDSEIGMYYLQSRYYNPNVGRFINGDVAEFAVFEQDILSHNLFGYCGNDCITKKDDTGFNKTTTYKGITCTEADKGFSVKMHAKFLSKIFCKKYANHVISKWGKKKKYCGMDSTRIAIEEFGHAVLFVLGIVFGAFSIWNLVTTWQAANYLARIFGIVVSAAAGCFAYFLIKHSKKIDVNNNEPWYRMAAYITIWSFFPPIIL